MPMPFGTTSVKVTPPSTPAACAGRAGVRAANAATPRARTEILCRRCILGLLPRTCGGQLPALGSAWEPRSMSTSTVPGSRRAGQAVRGCSRPPRTAVRGGQKSRFGGLSDRFFRRLRTCLQLVVHVAQQPVEAVEHLGERALLLGRQPLLDVEHAVDVERLGL